MHNTESYRSCMNTIRSRRHRKNTTWIKKRIWRHSLIEKPYRKMASRYHRTPTQRWRSRERNSRGRLLFLQNLKSIVNIFSFREDIDVEEVSITERRLTDAHNTLTLLIDSVSDIKSELTTTGRSHCNLLGHLHELRESVREISQYCITLNNVHSQNQESDDCLGPVSFSAPISWPPVLTPGTQTWHD